MITYNPSAGVEISEASEQAVTLAREKDEPVSFEFNGIILVAYTTDSAADVELRWHEESERRRKEYVASPEYARRQEQRRLDVLVSQNEVDRLLDAATRITEQVEWMRWAKDFALVADDVGVTFDKRELSDLLGRCGWVENAHVGKSPEEIQSSRTMKAEYIMGQVVNCLNHGMPPHPTIARFTEEYQSIAGK